MFKKLENNKPFAKLALEGFAGDGKTYTAVEIAIGIHKLINSKKPIALFDTERALKALKFRFDENNIEAIVDEDNRSLEALHQAMKWCEDGNADILIIDSITHVWEEFLSAYMKSKNKTRLEFQDWGIIKPQWKQKFSNAFVSANVHIIFTGRAGFEYENERNEETGKREIFKSGIKMKAETETAFEPDILILMEKEMSLLEKTKTVNRIATVIKDRTTRIDGKSFTNPKFDDFYPAIKQLLDGTIRMNLGGAEIPDSFADFDNKYSEIGRRREKAVNEIEGAFKLMGLSTGAQDQKIKAWCVKKLFDINSPDNLSTLKYEVLEAGVPKMNEFVRLYNNYLGDCAEKQEKPDPKQVDELMKKALTPADPEKPLDMSKVQADVVHEQRKEEKKEDAPTLEMSGEKPQRKSKKQ